VPFLGISSSENLRKTGTSKLREFLTLFRGTNVPFAQNRPQSQIIDWVRIFHRRCRTRTYPWVRFLQTAPDGFVAQNRESPQSWFRKKRLFFAFRPNLAPQDRDP